MIAVCHSRTTTAESQQLTLCAFLKFIILTVGFHLFATPDLVNRLAEQIAHHALKPAAGHYIAVGLDREMAVTAMATVVYRIGVAILRNLEQSFLIEV